MKLYDIYPYIVLGTSIGCLIGLAIAWYFFLSDQDKGHGRSSQQAKGYPELLLGNLNRLQLFWGEIHFLLRRDLPLGRLSCHPCSC